MDQLEYDISLDIDYHSLSIIGKEKIHFKDFVKEIELDAFDLKINSIKSNETDLSYRLENDSKKLKIFEISGNEISIEYETRVSEKMLHGIFKSRFDESYFVTTEFAPNGARLLFPCFDLPSYKAIFKLDVTTQKGLRVISNMPEDKIEDLDGRSRHFFKKSPKMSSYLLYLGIGNFERLETKDGKIPINVLARRGFAQKGQFALENAKTFLNALEEYYSIKYPLEKLDFIALPEFATGAMENWGAITFREVALLVDENTSVANKRQVTTNLAHELAHMWFGDLVTMRWWNDLWLNESFATFIGSKVSGSLFPDWNLITDFIQQQTVPAMLNDSLTNTHPIDQEVKAPEEISEIFDEISYGKGASVLRMTEDWIGEEAFRKGVSSYLSENMYGNAEGKDLWRSLEKFSGERVGEVLETWVKTAGFPLVRVSYEEGKLRFSQERFHLGQKSNQTEIWPIPINYTINEKERTIFLQDRMREISIDKIESVKVNRDQVGFYRTLYDKNLYLLVEQGFGNLKSIDRWGIITDLFAFLEAGLVEKELYFSFIRNCLQEKEYLVANEVRNQLYFLRYLLPEDPAISSLFIEYHRAQIDRLGFEPRKEDGDTDKILRGDLASGLVLVDEGLAKELSSKFNQYEKLDPNLRAAVAKAFAQTKGRDAYNDLKSTMKRLGSEADIMKIYAALTSFKDSNIVKEVLDFSIGGEISRADCLFAIFYANENPYAAETTWNWLKHNIFIVQELFQGSPYVAMIMQDTISRAGVEMEEKVMRDLEKINLPEAGKGIKKGLELLEVYSNLKRRLQSVS